MRSNPSCGPWADLVFTVGLVVVCFSQLSEPVLASSEPSHQLLHLASMFSGTFSNEEQVRQQEANGQPKLDINNPTFYPVHVPLFDPAVTLYMEEINNGQLVRRHIIKVGEDDQGLIHFKIHNLTRPLPEKPWASDSDGLPLTQDDLVYLEGCDPTFSEIEEGLFYGEWPNCLTYSPESHRSYTNVVTCNTIGFISPMSNNEPEMASHVPYRLKAITRYPLLPYSYAGVDNYQNLCL